ncbi:MAG: RNA 2',3'-cyclic phosphodiesterase [Methylococcaceae bacterium]|nr:RNA 2',3'-cyclic phosphodiesterase [Methylococcaceae bacterium]
MKRLFFALWPNENAREQCIHVLNSVSLKQARPVQAANIHVTLLFLGNLDLAKEESLRRELMNVSVPSITLLFNRLSFWEKSGVICLTATDSCPEIESVVENLEKLARKSTIQVDRRPFKPHVTLVKNVKTQIELKFEPIIWHSDSFCLVESCRFNDSIEYRIVEKR